MKKLRQRYKSPHLKIPCECGHKSAGIPEEAFDERMVHRGAKIEFEHTCIGEKAERIAMDHLSEYPHYYEELEKMEKKLKKIDKKAIASGKYPIEKPNKKCKKTTSKHTKKR